MASRHPLPGGTAEADSPKARLRLEARQRLQGIPRGERHAAARRARARLLDHPLVRDGRRIATCLSFGLEIDTWRTVRSFLAAGREVLVPRTAGGRFTLHTYPCPLERLSFGLQQPSAQVEAVDEAAIEDIDAFVVLGLAFDPRGRRLGYGKGYFDRFFARHPIPRLGYAFDEQIVPELPLEAHDVPMTAVVTPERIWEP